MKIVYTNKAINKQRNPSPSVKTIILMTCVVLAMVAVKVIYNPTDGMEEVAAMAEISGETLPSETEDSEDDADKMSYTAVKYIGEEFTYPLKGEITSAFAERQDPVSGEADYHLGIDIAGSCDIVAAKDGVVESVREGSSYGKYIKIRHTDSLETLYAHCSEISVTEGERVRAGQHIATAGDSGRATGVHLHFEVRVNGECVDPMEFLERAV